MRGGLYIETGFDYKEFFTEPKKKQRAVTPVEECHALSAGEHSSGHTSYATLFVAPTQQFSCCKFSKEEIDCTAFTP
jgi:hypothetical protein